ncbi:MAG: hypothetical protein ABI648_13990 [Betaproteobacteria bacterium]|jgi:hypothetical protein
MNLLHAIYVSPGNLLHKAKRSGKLLTEALNICDETAIRDCLFDFVVSAYHLWDWIKVYRPDLEQSVTALLSSSESLGACRDLCNASKHVILTTDRGSYLKYPPVVDAVSVSATSQASLAEINDAFPNLTNEKVTSVQPAWRLKVQMKSGERIAVEVLVSDVIGVWERFFADNDIR